MLNPGHDFFLHIVVVVSGTSTQSQKSAVMVGDPVLDLLGVDQG